VVQTESLTALNKFLSQRHAIGQVSALSGIYDALHVDGVKKVQLISPIADVLASDEQAAYCNDINVSIIVDE
jgi:phage-related baseplate assembly protein